MNRINTSVVVVRTELLFKRRHRQMKRVSFCEVLRGIQAIFARLLFLVHSVFAIWGATCVTGRNDLWALIVLCGLFILETVYSIVKRQGREPKWYDSSNDFLPLAAEPIEQCGQLPTHFMVLTGKQYCLPYHFLHQYLFQLYHLQCWHHMYFRLQNVQKCVCSRRIHCGAYSPLLSLRRPWVDLWGCFVAEGIK